MGLQFNLPGTQEAGKKNLIYVVADDCFISRFNTRKTRSEDDITKLADRIERNGFEVTRALWAYEENGKYEVFAGGNRLEAVRKTSHKDNVPILLHEGFTEIDYFRLAQEDNENDEYHTEVPQVDVWEHYARMIEEGYTAQDIIQQTGYNKTLVYDRIALGKMPKEFKKFFRSDGKWEKHAIGLLPLKVRAEFSDWLTTAQLQIKLARQAVKLTVKELREAISSMEEVIQTASDYYAKLPETGIMYSYKTDENETETCTQTDYDPKANFVQRLAENKPDTKRKVQNIISQIRKEHLEAIKEYEAFLKRQANEAETERQKQEEEERKRQEREFFYPKIFCLSSVNMDGELTDIDDAIHVIPYESVHLVITSPPYNIGKKYDVYNDSQEWEAYKEDLLNPVFSQCYKKLVVGGRIAVNTPKVMGVQGEPIRFPCLDISNILTDCGFELREMITWVKSENDVMGEVTTMALASNSTAWGSWCSPSNPTLRSRTEYILIAHKGQPQLEGDAKEIDLTEDEFKTWTVDTWFFPACQSSKHPAIFPEELPHRLIKLYSYPRQIVLDPFMGIGTTGIASIKNQRRFIGFDISETYCKEAVRAITARELFQ